MQRSFLFRWLSVICVSGCTLIFIAVPDVAFASAATTRGEALTPAHKQAAVDVATLSSDPEAPAPAPRDVVLKGRIEKVCQSKGCWFTIRNAASQGAGAAGPAVRVTSRGYLFFVPKDLAGRTAYVRGTLTRKKLSAAETQHFADDEARVAAAGASPVTGSEEKPQSGKSKPATAGESFEWQLEAVGVSWEG